MCAGKPAGADLQLGLATAPVLFASKEFPRLDSLIGRLVYLFKLKLHSWRACGSIAIPFPGLASKIHPSSALPVDFKKKWKKIRNKKFFSLCYPQLVSIVILKKIQPIWSSPTRLCLPSNSYYIYMSEELSFKQW